MEQEHTNKVVFYVYDMGGKLGNGHLPKNPKAWYEITIQGHMYYQIMNYLLNYIVFAQAFSVLITCYSRYIQGVSVNYVLIFQDRESNMWPAPT